jgi:hypothetical protein
VIASVELKPLTVKLIRTLAALTTVLLVTSATTMILRMELAHQWNLIVIQMTSIVMLLRTQDASIPALLVISVIT